MGESFRREAKTGICVPWRRYFLSGTDGGLEDELHYTAMAPYSGTVYDLKEAAFISCPEGVVIRKQETKPQSKGSGVYQRLVAAGQRLLTVIRHNEGGANKDLAETDQPDQ